MPGEVVRSFALVIAIATTATRAQAQVNTENLRKRIKSSGYSLILEGTLTGNVGNTEGIAAGGGIGGGWGRDPHLLFGYARADYSRYGGVTSIDKTFAHVRYNYEVEPWLWGELFAQAQSDAFQRLTLRNLFGAGPRFRVLHQLVPRDLDAYVGTAYMLERDIISVAPGASDREVYVWHRWSSYATARWELDERVTMASTIYVQPAIPEVGSVRVLDETLFTFKVTTLFSASVSGTVRYDSTPPTGVKRTDVEIKNALTLLF